MEKRVFRLGLGILFLLVVVCLVKAVGLIESNQWEANLTGVRFSAVAFGDIDNDNRSEVILTGCLSASEDNCNMGTITRIYSNNGTALIFNNTYSNNLTGVGWGGASLGDLNNDGTLDLIIVGCKSATSTCDDGPIAKVYINNGTSLLENQTWQTNLTGVWDGNIILGDVNNDGRLDLFLNGHTGTIAISKIYINNGTTFMDNKEWGINLTGVYQGSSAMVDMDQDGYNDIVLTGDDSYGTKITKVYRNNGTSFIELQSLLSIDRSSIIFGDFDNDGLTDIAIIGQSAGDHFYIYRNNKTLFVQNQTGIGDGGESLLGLYRGSLGFGDYNNDGYLDIVATGKETTRNRVYKNNITNFLVDTVASSDLQTDDFVQGALSLGDIDNDNNIDIIATGYSFGEQNIVTKVYINNLTTNNSLPYPPSTFLNYSLANGEVFLNWNNGSDNETHSLGLYYNLRVGTTSSGNDIASGVFGGSSGGGGGGGGANGYFGNMMQRRNITLSGSRFQVNTTYYWSVQTIDTGLAKSAWSTEQTFNLASDFTPPTITINSPSDGLVTNQTRIVFNATIVDDYILSNVSLYGNWSDGWHKNETNASGINNTNYIFIKNLTEGTWLWGIRACDNLTNCRSSENYTIRIDTTLPSTFLMSPANSTTQTSLTTVTFSYNVSDVAINNCSLIINGAVQTINTSITINTSQTFTETLSNGNYNWSVRCTDAANNINSSATYLLTISYTAPTTPSSSSGGGGSGGGAVASANKVSRIIASINVGNNLIEFTEKETATMGVEEILIDSATDARYVKISVEKLSTKPTSIEFAPTENVYTYLQIEKTVLNDTDIKSTKIKFTVNKTWLNENNYDPEKIFLNRYTTKWEQLPTKLLSGGSQFYYYKTTSPGFSTFAITAEKKTEDQKGVLPAENITEETNLSEQKENAPQQEKTKKQGRGALLLAAAIVIVLTILLIKMKKRKREKR